MAELGLVQGCGEGQLGQAAPGTEKSCRGREYEIRFSPPASL